MGVVNESVGSSIPSILLSRLKLLTLDPLDEAT